MRVQRSGLAWMSPTLPATWPSLNLFCADCRFRRRCPRRTSAEVEACPLVRAQRAEDLGAARPMLLAAPEEDPQAVVRDLDGGPLNWQRRTAS